MDLIEIREIRSNDKEKYVFLIDQLIHIQKDISDQEFSTKLDQIKQQGGKIFMLLYAGEIVGTGKVIIESKLYDPVAHIEDIVIDLKYRNKGFGKRMITFLCEYGEKQGCYKVVLNCKDTLEAFYSIQCNFDREGLQMVSRYY